MPEMSVVTYQAAWPGSLSPAMDPSAWPPLMVTLSAASRLDRSVLMMAATHRRG